MQTFLRRLEILNYLKSQSELVATEDILQHLREAGYLDETNNKAKSLYRLIQRDLGFLLGETDEEGEHENEFGLYSERGTGKSRLWRLEPYSQLSYSFEKMPNYMALALAISQKHLKQILPSDTQSVLKQIFLNAQEKLIKQERALSPKHYQKLTQSVEFFQRGQQLKAADFNTDLLDQVYRAILQGKRIQISYQSSGAIKEYDLHPFGVAIMLPKIYLVAKKDADINQGDDAFRSFLIHKITDLSLSTLPNKVPDDFALKSYLEQGNMDVLIDSKDIETYQLELTLQCKDNSSLLLDLRDTPISHDQKLTKLSESNWCLSATTRRTVQLRNWLLSLGPQAKINSPEIIQQDIISYLSQIQANYTHR